LPRSEDTTCSAVHNQRRLIESVDGIEQHCLLCRLCDHHVSVNGHPFTVIVMTS